MLRTRVAFLMLCVGVMFAAGACGSSPPTRFYILDSTATDGAMAGSPDLVLGVGPISFPPYLDRPELVTLANANQLKLADQDQWAEPLESGFVRVLSEDLSALLGTEQIDVHPWTARPDIRVEVEILRFDGDASGGVKLIARWWVRGDADRAAGKRSVISIAPTGAGYLGTAGAMSRAIGQLAGEIAAEIKAR